MCTVQQHGFCGGDQGTHTGGPSTFLPPSLQEIDEETRKVIKDVAQFEPLDELCNHIFAKRDAHGGSRDHPWVKLKTISSTHTPLDYQLHIPSVPVRHQPLGESLLLFSLVL